MVMSYHMKITYDRFEQCLMWPQCPLIPSGSSTWAVLARCVCCRQVPGCMVSNYILDYVTVHSRPINMEGTPRDPTEEDPTEKDPTERIVKLVEVMQETRSRSTAKRRKDK